VTATSSRKSSAWASARSLHPTDKHFNFEAFGSKVDGFVPQSQRTLQGILHGDRNLVEKVFGMGLCKVTARTQAKLL